MGITDISMMQWRNVQTNTDTSKLQNRNQENQKLKEACLDFEAIFVKQMLDSMRKTVIRGGLTEKNMAEDIFEDMLYDEYAKKLAKTSNLGIASMMYQQLSQNDTV